MINTNEHTHEYDAVSNTAIRKMIEMGTIYSMVLYDTLKMFLTLQERSFKKLVKFKYTHWFYSPIPTH